jgi:fumarylacetoacetase
VLLQTVAMARQGLAPAELSRANFRDAYWSVAQMLAHHSSGGCNLQAGDLLGTGTQSGPVPGQGGSLLELSLGGQQPVPLPGGETRSFLQDGDTLILRAHCHVAGARRIGFGECRGTVVPARAA